MGSVAEHLVRAAELTDPAAGQHPAGILRVEDDDRVRGQGNPDGDRAARVDDRPRRGDGGLGRAVLVDVVAEVRDEVEVLGREVAVGGEESLLPVLARRDGEPQRGLEVDDWDAMEQARVVTGDEDDYR